MAVVAAEGGWTPDCVRRLYSECHVQLKDMHNLRACPICAKEDPEQLDMGFPNVPVPPVRATGPVLPAFALFRVYGIIRRVALLKRTVPSS